MLIMVEGVDCSGKTWVVHELLKKLEGEVFLLKHGNRPKTGSLEEIELLKKTYADMLNIYKQFSLSIFGYESIPTHFIFDRYFHSELAYSQVMRGYEARADDWYKRLEKEVEKENHLLLYVQADWGIIEARLKSRGDDYVSLSQAKTIRGIYKKIVGNTSLNRFVIVNNDLPNIDGVIELIRERSRIEHT